MFTTRGVAPPFISTLSRYSSGVEWSGSGGTAGAASTAWGTANLARFYLLRLPFMYPMRRMFVANGATISGNVDVGIYTQAGTKIWTSGSTAQSGASVLQYFNATDTLLMPGTYILALAMSSATATVHRVTGSFAGGLWGATRQASAFTLPDPLTIATSAEAYLAIFGITSTPTGFPG